MQEQIVRRTVFSSGKIAVGVYSDAAEQSFAVNRTPKIDGPGAPESTL